MVELSSTFETLPIKPPFAIANIFSEAPFDLPASKVNSCFQDTGDRIITSAAKVFVACNLDFISSNWRSCSFSVFKLSASFDLTSNW